MIIISQDSFYRPLTPHERENVSEFNFDHPCNCIESLYILLLLYNAEAKYFWSHAAAFDWDLLLDTVKALKDPRGGPVEIPNYDFVTHSRFTLRGSSFALSLLLGYAVWTCSMNLIMPPFFFRLKETTPVYGVDVILLEGILVFYHPELRSLFDMRIFVDTDADTRLARRGALK